MGQNIAALDLGTSKSVACVVQKDFRGKLSDFHFETLPSKQAIRRGRIINLDETSDIITRLVRKLNDSLSAPVEKMYVGIGGQSLRTQLLCLKKEVESGTISQQLLDSLRQEALSYQPEIDKNLGVFSCEYYADGQLVLNPKGILASFVEARFQLIVGNPCLKRNLESIFSNKNISVARYFISPLATAEAVLTPEEKKSGCALIELGEGVTYVSVYKNESLKYLITIPVGGLAITKDIRSLNVTDEEAEILKVKYGSAILESNEEGTAPVNEELNPSRTIELKNLNWIIEARVEEIVRNAWSHIMESGYSHTLDAGIIITGGGALLKNLPQFIRNLTGIEVRLANPKIWVHQVETPLSPAESCLIGLATLGTENCLKEKVPFSTSKTPVSPTPVQTPRPVYIPPPPPPLPPPQPPFPPDDRKIKGRFKKLIDKGMKFIFEDDEFGYNATKKSGNKDTADIGYKNKDS